MPDMPPQAPQHMHGGFWRRDQKADVVVVFGENEWFLPLSRSVAADAVFDSTGVVVKTADGRVSGGPGLKETQAYPAGYSLELLGLWKDNRVELEAEDCSSVSDTGYQELDDCEWALLDICCADFAVSAVEFQC